MVGPIRATFRASRAKVGIVLRYEFTNGSDTDVLVKSGTIWLRADGRPAVFGMIRNGVDRGRPGVIPHGATETGAIDIAKPDARQVELIVSLLPLSTPPQTGPDASRAPEAHPGIISLMKVPFVMQATFSGLDRLPIAPSP